MAQNVEQNPENRLAQPSEPPHSTGATDDVSAVPASAELDERAEDLPDIIDLVMEMGSVQEEPPAEAPSPPLPVVTNPRLPAHLDALADRARDYVEAASSSNTRRAYQSDWKQFSSWCRRQGVEMFPPDPQIVGLYITASASGNVDLHFNVGLWHFARERYTPIETQRRGVSIGV